MGSSFGRCGGWARETSCDRSSAKWSPTAWQIRNEDWAKGSAGVFWDLKRGRKPRVALVRNSRTVRPEKLLDSRLTLLDATPPNPLK